jgi:protein-L-isoaspartate(D-aspartate) O-methyltransferase
MSHDSPLHDAGERAASIRSLIKELRTEGIRSDSVLQAMQTVPRDQFVLPEYVAAAWRNTALPIGSGQTISQPYVVALMTEALELTGDETVLDVGTGSGYQAAVLAGLCRHVVGVERIPELVSGAKKKLQGLGLTNVEVHEGDGSLGWPEKAPFDGILVAAAGPHVPEALLKQLADGGRLVIPVGAPSQQVLMQYRREGETIHSRQLTGVRFVPLIGAEGWTDGFAED